RPHNVEALRAEGPLEHVRLHEVTAGMGAVVGARDVHAAREVDPDRLGPGLVRHVEVAPEAAADVEHELSAERLDGERAAQVAAEVRAPPARRAAAPRRRPRGGTRRGNAGSGGDPGAAASCRAPRAGAPDAQPPFASASGPSTLPRSRYSSRRSPWSFILRCSVAASTRACLAERLMPPRYLRSTRAR